MKSYTLEEAKTLRTELGPAAVDVSLLSDEVRAEFLAWLSGDEPETQPETSEAQKSEVTHAWLTSINGIGKKGAEAILEELAARGVTTFAAFAKIEDLTKLPAIGKKNGANLRAALDEVAGPYDPVAELEIRCPHCNGLFDRAPIGEYDSGEAWCSVEDGAGEGNCGQTFWLVATDSGYVTHKTNPKYAQYTITGQGVVDEVVSELAPESETELPTVTCPRCGAAELDMDGFGMLVCPRDPKCYCTHPHTIDGVCGICGYRESSASDLIPPETLLDGGEAVLDWPTPAATAEPVELAPALIPIHERIHPALTSCRVLAKTKSHSDDWHKARAQGVGSSDAGAILGVSPYAKAHDVWASKLGHEAKQKPWLEDYADFGTWFEPYIREWCEDEHGIEIIDGADLGTLQSVVWPRALANIDGLDITNGVVEEYKTTTEKWTEIPAHYFAQVQHQMLVTGVHEVRLRQYVAPMDRRLIPSLLDEMLKLDPSADRALADWLLEHGEVHTWIIERDDSYIERMLTREKSFWTFVEMEIEPVEAEPEGSADLSVEVWGVDNLDNKPIFPIHFAAEDKKRLDALNEKLAELSVAD